MIERARAWSAILLAAALAGAGCRDERARSSSGGERGFTPAPLEILSCELDAGPLRADNRLPIRVQVDVRNARAEPANELTLHLVRGALVEAVSGAEGKTVAFTPYSGRVVLRLDRPLPAGGRRTFELRYSLGSVENGVGVTDSEAVALGAAEWYPSELPRMSVESQRTLRPAPPFRIRVHGDQHSLALATGATAPMPVPVEFSGRGGDLGGLHVAIAPYLPPVAGVEQGVEMSLVLRRESLGEDRQAWIRRIVSGATRELRDLVSDPSPEPVLAVSSNAVRLGRAGMSLFFGPWLFTDPPDHLAGAGDVGREIARRFFGERLAIRGPGSHWIEGFVDHAAARCVDRAFGTDRFAGEQRRGASRLYESIRGGVFDVPLDRTTETNVSVYRHKGSLVVHALRLELGEERFRRALASAFATGLERGPLSLEELRRALEKGCGRGLDAFFAQWVHSTDVPRVLLEREEASGSLVAANQGPGRAVFEVVERSGEAESRRVVALDPGERTEVRGTIEELALVEWLKR